MGPRVHGGPDYMCVFTFWVTISRGSGSFLVRGHPRLPRRGGGHLKRWSKLSEFTMFILSILTSNNPKLCLNCCIFLNKWCFQAHDWPESLPPRDQKSRPSVLSVVLLALPSSCLKTEPRATLKADFILLVDCEPSRWSQAAWEGLYAFPQHQR